MRKHYPGTRTPYSCLVGGKSELTQESELTHPRDRQNHENRENVENREFSTPPT